MKIKPKDIVIPAVCLFTICLIMTTILAFVNLNTVDSIKQQAEKKKIESCKIVLPTAETFEEKSVNDIKYYVGLSESGEIVGYVFITKAKGYGGDISVMTGIKVDKNVCGVVILAQNETPGLGTNTTKESFTNQYKQDISLNNFKLVKTSPANGEIQAVTGATISSTAVTNAVNEAVKDFNQVISMSGGAE